jgi:hypothetical protein
MKQVKISLTAFTTLKNEPNIAPPSTPLKPKRSQISGYFHALVMLFCFGILLGTTYTEQQPYVYSSSHQALMLAIKQSDALSVGTVEDIWTWIDAVISSTGGDGVDSINANCQYDSFNSQEVVIDGVTYTLEKPSYQSNSCDENNMNFVIGSENEVYLTGNHQLLSFGIFSLRSVPQYPVQNSVRRAKKSQIKVRSSEVAPLNPVRDDKVVELCDAPWGRCLYRDGFDGEAGSTFNWIGREIDGYYAFQEGSSSFMILPPEVTYPVTIQPCFTYRSDNNSVQQQFIVQPGNPLWSGNISNITLESCGYKWISTGYTIRETCLSLSNSKPIPIVAYLARQEGLDEVYPLLNSYFGCSALFSVSSQQMKALYVSSDKCLESNILGDRAYGVFVSTENQDLWIRQSVVATLQLQAHKYFDDNTRVVRIYFITRSLGREQLFYTIITVEYAIGVDGKIVCQVTATYVPMIMFQYGYGEYEWRVKDVYRFEMMLLIIFVLFTAREIYQLVTKRLIWLLPDRMRRWFQRSAEGKRGKGEGEGNGGNESDEPEKKQIPNFVRSARVGIAPVRVRPSETMEAGGENGGSSMIQMMTIDDCEGEGAQGRSFSDPHRQQCPSGSGEGKQDSPSPHTPVITHKPSQLLSEPSERLDVEHLVEEMNEMVDDLGEAIEDIIEDYTPDSDGMHDLLDWLTIAVITIGIIYRVDYVKSAAALHTYLMNLEDEGTYDDHLEQIVAQFADIESQDQAIHLIAIAVIAVGMLQFFRYLSFSQRFGIVTTTMAASANDLLPVLVIFVSIVIAYAILASEIYGIQMEEYSTVQSSLAALFIVLLGNFDYYSSKFNHSLSLSLSLCLSSSLSC